jgi:hypothetical protein
MTIPGTLTVKAPIGFDNGDATEFYTLGQCDNPSGIGIFCLEGTNGYDAKFALYSPLSDGSHDVNILLYGLNDHSQATREWLLTRWRSADDWYEIRTSAAGIGSTPRKLYIYTANGPGTYNVGQLILNTTGDVEMNTGSLSLSDGSVTLAAAGRVFSIAPGVAATSYEYTQIVIASGNRNFDFVHGGTGNFYFNRANSSTVSFYIGSTLAAPAFAVSGSTGGISMAGTLDVTGDITAHSNLIMTSSVGQEIALKSSLQTYCLCGEIGGRALELHGTDISGASIFSIHTGGSLGELQNGLFVYAYGRGGNTAYTSCRFRFVSSTSEWRIEARKGTASPSAEYPVQLSAWQCT